MEENPIIPAIMPQSFDDIREYAGRVVGHVSTVQLDIMDGKFVPETTWPFKEVAGCKRRPAPHGAGLEVASSSWAQLQEQEAGLPFWEEVDYELDLMVQDADKKLDEWIALGPRRIIFHLEALEDVVGLLEKAQGVRSLVEIGLAIGSATPVRELFPHLEMIDCVQLMGIGRIGFQGEPFDETVLDRIRELKVHAPHMLVQVDGAVSRDTINELCDAGAERFAVGSAIWRGGDAGEMVGELKEYLYEK